MSTRKTASPATPPGPDAAGAPAPPPSGPVAVTTTRLKVLRTHPGYPHNPGDEAEMDAEAAQALANGGFVQVLTTDITTAETR
ncbi:hypothetical protein [Hymenobacter agri]